MAEASQASLQTQSPRPMSDVVIDRIWRFFCSVRAAIAEIGILALLVLIGTLRGSDAPQWLADALPFTQTFVDRWYDWDVFSSILFSGILAILAIAVAVCTINRAPAIWQTISHPKLTTTRGWLRGADTSATFATTGDVIALTGTMTGILKQRRYRVLTQSVGNDIHLYADKNRFAKMGTFPFHLALILILVGGLVGSHYGFRDREFIVVEGQTRDVGHGTGLSIRLDRFEDNYTAMGVASQYKSTLTIFEDGNDVKSGDITVNHPINYHSATIYQADLGYAKQFKITDRSGNVIYDDASPLGIFNLKGNREAPAGLIDLPSVNGQLVFAGPDTNAASLPELDQLQLTSDQLWVQLSTRDASGRMVPLPDQKVVLNQPVQMGDYTITFTGTKAYSLMQVAYNPGVPIFIIASVLLIGGLVATFYFPLRRVRAILTPTPTGATIQMAPLAKRDWSGKQDFMRIIEKTRAELGEPQDIKLPKSGSEWEKYAPPAASA